MPMSDYEPASGYNLPPVEPARPMGGQAVRRVPPLLRLQDARRNEGKGLHLRRVRP